MNRLILRRTGALGDVILLTAVVRHLRSVTNLTVPILVQTAYPAVFNGNLAVSGLLDPPERPRPDDLLLDFDLSYERRPDIHIVAAYSAVLEAAGFPPIPHDQWHPEMFFLPRPHNEEKTIQVAVHAARSWPSRTLPTSFWLDVMGRLRAAGIRPVLVGTNRDIMTGPHCTTDLAATALTIARAHVLIGSDSSLLHVAAAVGTPVVGLYTSVRPEYRMTGEGNFFTPKGLVCAGCLVRAPAPTTRLTTCERGDTACIWRFDAADVVDAALNYVPAR